MDGLTPRMFGILLCSRALFAQPKLNFVFYGDSQNGETDTYPFKVSQQYVGSTYTKLGYHWQPTDYLLVHLDRIASCSA